MPNTQQSDTTELKAGHPPAVKVGNMRVVQRTHSTSSDKHDPAEESQAGEQSGGGSGGAGGDSSVPSACSFAPKTVVQKNSSGLPERAVEAVQTDAVKQIHEKPQASHEYRGHSNKPSVIMQPKK